MAKYTGTLSDLCITYTALTRILLLYDFINQSSGTVFHFSPEFVLYSTT